MRIFEIRLKWEIEEIIQWTKPRKIEWDQHMDRMAEDKLVGLARDRSPYERRAIGRSRKRSLDNLNRSRC